MYAHLWQGPPQLDFALSLLLADRLGQEPAPAGKPSRRKRRRSPSSGADDDFEFDADQEPWGRVRRFYLFLFSANLSFQCDPCSEVKGKCRPFRGAPTYAPCQQCIRRRQECTKVSLRYYKSLASNAKRIEDLKMERGAPPKRALQVEVEVPPPPPARPVRAQRTRRAPSPVAGPSRLSPSPAAAAPPADGPLHRFRDIDYLIEQIERGEALATWVAHHCVEMRLAIDEVLANRKPVALPAREKSPRDKGKGRAEPQDNECPPAATSDEDEDGDFENWGGIRRAA